MSSFTESLHKWKFDVWDGTRFRKTESMILTCIRRKHAAVCKQCQCNRTLTQFWICTNEYSRTSLSRTRLFRITVCLEVKIWSLFYHETMTIGNKRMWKIGEIAPKEQFLLFSTLCYIYISNLRSQITYSFVKYGCSIYCFPHSLNSDMSRYGYLEVFQWVPWNSR